MTLRSKLYLCTVCSAVMAAILVEMFISAGNPEHNPVKPALAILAALCGMTVGLITIPILLRHLRPQE